MTQSAKRILSMLIALLFLAAAFVAFFDLVEPAYAAVETLRGQLAGEQASLASEKNMVAAAQSLITAYESQSTGLESIALAVPTGEDAAGAITQIEGLAQNDNVAISSIAVGSPSLNRGTTSAPAVSSGATSSSTASIVKPLGSYVLKLNGVASYEALANFLAGLETNIRIFDVQELSITPAPAVVTSGKSGSTGSRDLFSYDISVQTYYQLP